MESLSTTPEVILGFLEEPKNSLILTAPFLPNKIGGLPVTYLSSVIINLIRLGSLTRICLPLNANTADTNCLS